MPAGERTFAAFMEEVRASLEGHAERKGYSNGGADGVNPLAEFMVTIGAEPGHSVGEIIHKCVEHLKSPRDVNLVKIAAWAFIAYRHGKAR